MEAMFLSYVRRSILLLLSVFSLMACKKQTPVEETQPETTTPAVISYPSNFPEMFVPESNPLTEEGIELGRYLYYDTRLSTGGPLVGNACASCHIQSKAFTSGSTGTAVLAHMNLGWANYFLWNGYIGGTLEDIMRFEVNDFFQTDMSGIKSDPAYAERFNRAFGTPDINNERAAMALAQFFRALSSTNSKFDRYLAHQTQLSPSEMNGFVIYYSEKGDCFHCHTLPLMTDNLFHNIGIDSIFNEGDKGRFEVTGATTDLGLFKTPTLRNVAVTGPYMHDNRFATLEEVIEHYNSGVKHSSSLDPIMTKPSKEFGLQLTDQEKADLIAFLHTLTDSTYLSNAKLSDPF